MWLSGSNIYIFFKILNKLFKNQIKASFSLILLNLFVLFMPTFSKPNYLIPFSYPPTWI